MIKISRIISANAKDLKDINRLLPQLSILAKPLTAGTYRKLLSDKNTCFLAARDGVNIVGIGSVIFMRSPLFTAGYITDVVVDRSMRGRGIGKGIVKELMRISKKVGMDMVELTSRPSRIAANKLYRSMRFQKRNTNVYRMKLK